MRICECLLITVISKYHCRSAIRQAAFTDVVKGPQWAETACKVNSEKLLIRICNYNVLGNEWSLHCGTMEGWKDRREGRINKLDR